MNTISANGELVHVVLCVRSVTSEGVTVLIKNSPNLLTLHVHITGRRIPYIQKHLAVALEKV